METLIKMIINLSLLLGSGYFAKKILLDIEKMTSKRIKKGVSSSEGLTRKLTSTKLSF